MEKISTINLDLAEETEVESAQSVKLDEADEAQHSEDSSPPEARRLYAQPEDTAEIHGNVITSTNVKPTAKATGARFDIKI